ncbi:unnamed protein product [Rotaria magnacalcarata]
MLNSDIIALLLLASSFQIVHIAAITCNKSNIIHSVQDDNVNITFLSTEVIRLNRSVLCTSNSSFEFINGPEYHCMRLGYGHYGQILIQIQNDNGVVDNCSITYVTKLYVANLAYINAIADRVRLSISRPLGSFDYVIVHCPDDKSHIIFNTSLPSNDLMMSVHCSFLLNMPLMSFVIETIKKDFDSTVNHIIQEVPLPVPMTSSLDSLLLTIIANPAPTINLASRYEFNLIFHGKDTDSITYERVKISDLKLYSNTTLKYGLIPNLKHEISFDHIVDSIGFAHSYLTITPTSNVSYPYEVANFSIDEQFHKIVLRWTDTHSWYDPIEFIVSCNSSQKSSMNIGRNTSYTCEQMTFHETDIVSVQTKVAIPGYIHDQTAVVQINVKQVPEIPLFEVFNKTENDITIRWNYNSSSLMSNSFKYKVQCGLYEDASDIDIHSNQYQCQPLEDGSLHVITMHLISVNNTIKRSSSIQATTLLQKCQPKNHLFIPDIDGTISIIIEWIPPKHNFEKIIIYCPLTIMTYENHQVVSLMYVKCKVKHGSPFQVSFVTVKSGFEDAIFKFTDTAPSVDSTTTTDHPEIIATTTPPVFGSTTTPPVFGSTTTTTPPVFGSSTTTPPVFGSTTTPPVFGSTTTTTPPVTRTPPVFGNTTTTTPPVFGSSTTTPPVFGSTTTPPVFGSITTTSPLFGSTTTKPPAFGSTTTTPPVFGSTTTTSPVFGSTTTTPPIFGSTTTTPPVFESTTTTPHVFGSTTTKPPVFGSTTTTPPVFGSTTTTSPAFGSTTTASPVFGSTTTTPPIFGSTTTTPPVLGSTTTKPPVFGSTTTTPPVFESTTTTPPIFGSTTTMPPVFGSSTTTPPVFGSTTTRTTTTVGSAKTTSSRSTTTTTTASEILATSTETVSSTTVRNITTDRIVKPEEEVTKWRTAAIIAFIVIGFLLLATIALTTFSIFAAFRKR